MARLNNLETFFTPPNIVLSNLFFPPAFHHGRIEEGELLPCFDLSLSSGHHPTLRPQVLERVAAHQEIGIALV